MIRDYSDILTLWIYLGAIVPLFSFLWHLAQREKNTPLAFFFLCFSITSLWNAFYYDGWLLSHPYLVLFFLSFTFMPGPVNLNLGLSMLGGARKGKLNLYVHLTPLAVVLAFLLGAYLLLPDLMEPLLKNSIVTREFSILYVIGLSGFIHNSAYMSIFLMAFAEARRELKTNLYRVNAFIIFIVCAFGCTFIYAVGLLTNRSELVSMGLSGNTLAIVVFQFFNSRYPKFFENFLGAVEQIKYRNTSLDNLDIAVITSRLNHLMEAEALFLEPDLKVVDLVQRLEITQHQLSRIFDEVIQKNFNEYVNGYRIEKAKNSLIQKPEMAIIHIAYDCGFNSKSTFNNVFTKHTGTSPSKYRLDNR